MNYFMGIDPGATGAAVVIDDDLTVAKYFDWPGDESALAATLQSMRIHGPWPDWTVLEQVHSMPGQGVASTFKFGRNFGVWLGVLASFQLPFQLVTPQAWRKGLMSKGDGATTKEQSLAVARRTWPQETIFKRQKDNGRADAALMALYARKRWKGR